MQKNNISAEVVAHSLSPQREELLSVLVTFPRIILAEVNTHRMLSKNTSSSRAIPFLKMVETVKNNPFIPIAWQKNHPGMQGTEYLSKTDKFNLIEFIYIMSVNLRLITDEESVEYKKLNEKIEEKIHIVKSLLTEYTLLENTLDEWWLLARDKAVELSSIMYVFDVTKQLTNRLLEPFMWTTMLITGSKSGWDNFFRLRCPSYEFGSMPGEKFRSKKDAREASHWCNRLSDLEWLQANTGQAEIHIMDLAEKIWDAVNESTPKVLKPREWHIPFGGRITDDDLDENLHISKNLREGMSITNDEEQNKYWNRQDLLLNEARVKVSTAMAARTSYTVVGEEKGLDYEALIGLHDRLIAQDPPHSSPFEHAARCQTEEEYLYHYRSVGKDSGPELLNNQGWCYNLKGFISYRYMVDNKINL